jgi:DNA-binding transcriptional LysR family regulator
MKHATFRQLRVFNEVSKHLSFIRAAEALHLTPPAVTMQIKELENNVGMPLFDRAGKKVSLTTAGEYMLVYARRILATVKDAEDAAARLQHAEAGTITIGLVRTAKYYMMHLISEFRREHEGIDIKLSIGNREQLLNNLQGNEVDLAVMGRPPKEMRTRAEPFAAHPHVFIAATDNPLYRQSLEKQLTAEDIRQQPFIVREEGSGTRAAMERFFEGVNIEPNYKFELDSNEMIKQAVIADLGIGFVSQHTVGLELENQKLGILNVDGAPIVRAWNLVHTQSKVLSPAAEAFRYFMLERAESFLAEQFGSFE